MEERQIVISECGTTTKEWEKTIEMLEKNEIPYYVRSGIE